MHLWISQSSSFPESRLAVQAQERGVIISFPRYFTFPAFPTFPTFPFWLCQNSLKPWPSRNSEFSHEKWWIFPYQHSQPLLTFHFPMVFPWFSHGCGRVFVLNRPKSTQILCTDGTPIGNLQLLQDCHQVLEALALSPCWGNTETIKINQ